MSKLGTMLPLETVKRSAGRVLRLVMKSRKFREVYLGRIFVLEPDKPLTIQPDEISEISCNITRLEVCNDRFSRLCHTRLCKDQRGRDIFIQYYINAAPGRYCLSVRTAAVSDTTSLELTVDGVSQGLLVVTPTGDMHCFQTTGTWDFALTAGEHTFRLYIRDAADTNSCNIGALIFDARA